MTIELKRLTEKELELMRNWRNRDDISAHMFTSKKITPEQQIKWFEKYKQDDTQIRWVIYADGTPIGSMYVTDVDRVNMRCESGWFIAEKKGTALTLPIYLQQNLLDYVFDKLDLNRVYGYILGDNKGLLKLLQLCGFEVDGVLKEHACKGGEFVDVYVVGITKSAWAEKKSKFKYEKIEIE